MWYYSSDGQQRGPVDDVALDQLIAAGTVTADTPVWKQGLADWIPLKQLRTPQKMETVVEDAGSSTCSMCGKKVGADNLIDLLGLRVCAACKPTAVQTLREGGTLSANNTAWRDGKKVVTHGQKSLPSRCYKCNGAVTGAPLTRKVYWHPPVYYLLILAGIVVHVGIIIYVVVAMIVRKRASVDIFLCARHAQRRKYSIIGGWIGAVLAIVMVIAGITANIGVMTGIGFILLLVSILAGLIGASLARASRIKDDKVWMSGASKEFLASLPAWTHDASSK